jgi:hypothetical protein
MGSPQNSRKKVENFPQNAKRHGYGLLLGFARAAGDHIALKGNFHGC